MDKIIAELRELLQRPGPKHVLTQEGYRIVPDENLNVLLEHIESQAAALKQCGERIQAIQSIAEDAGKSSVADDLNTIIVFCDIALALPAVREATAEGKETGK